ncbi:hypothetical protein [Siccirubricoccus sp. G192]|uniref:hypothetical protein n=1 Tax=Siccirubricoccus sp. G192 TaxID=2849651 RepID=UPI001C2C7C94|nr:hypothetical protein [Siccirubricoccus sp. G192]MBV1800474.1 hypothetical protein [Siccirubricoccus sp. G192]
MTDKSDMNREAEWLAAAASHLEPASRSNSPGALRSYLREHLAAVLAAKGQQRLSWEQTAMLLTERGLTREDGGPLNGKLVSAMASQVADERDPVRLKRRTTKGSRQYRRSPDCMGPGEAICDITFSPTPNSPPPAAPVAPAPAAGRPEAGKGGDAEIATRARAALQRNKRAPLREPDPINITAADRRPKEGN